MGKAARIARRRGLGRPLHSYRQAFPPWWHLLFVGIVLVIVAAVSLNQTVPVAGKIAGISVPLLATGIAWWVLTDVRLVLCEGGLLIGRFFPGMPPFAIPYRAIEPRGVTCVEDIGRFSRATGRSYGSTLFYFPQSRRGILVDGPTAAQAREGSSLGGGMFDTAADTVRGGKIWAFAYSGRPEVITAQLQQGLAAQGVPYAEALQSVALPERSVGASPQEARERINGLAR